MAHNLLIKFLQPNIVGRQQRGCASVYMFMSNKVLNHQIPCTLVPLKLVAVKIMLRGHYEERKGLKWISSRFLINTILLKQGAKKASKEY